MTTLLILVLVAGLALVAYRWSKAIRAQRYADPPGPDPTPMPGHLPVEPKKQVRRATRAQHTFVEPGHAPPKEPPKDSPF